MRYVIAMIGAVIGAALMMVFFASDLATTIVASNRFDSPDEVADLHTAIFMGLNIVGLVAGWIAGWVLGALLSPPHSDDDEIKQPSRRL
jgi:hypothetical protein